MRISYEFRRLAGQLTFVLAGVLLCWFAGAELRFNTLMQQASARYGQVGSEFVGDWRRLLDAAQGIDEMTKLKRANLFFNLRLRFQSDQQIWGQADYWATPLESMTRGAGDCEDFSIAKYVTLRAMGVDASKLRLIYVKAQLDGRSQAHMVIGYFSSPTAEPLVLDNIRGEILPGSQRPDLTPVFSFNDAGLWAGGKLASSDPTARLSHWRDLLQRLSQEGFL